MTSATREPRPFRFGVLTPILSDVRTWQDQVRRVADSGYATLLMPDVPRLQPAPGPALAVAAGISDLRVGTWVSASPFRSAFNLAWEAHTLSVVTEGRFELGLGTGRPGIEDELRTLGMPVLSAGERLTRLRESVATMRDLDGPDLHTPVVMAVRGPKARRVAAEIADTVTFAMSPDDERTEVDGWVRDMRSLADVELALHISVIGERRAPFMTPPTTDPAALRAADSLSYLPGDPKAAVEELHRRRDELGFSYVVIGSNSAEAFAPVVAELTGT